MEWVLVNIVEAILMTWFISSLLDIKKIKVLIYRFLLSVANFLIITLSNYISMYDLLLTTIIITISLIISIFYTYNNVHEILFVLIFESMFACIITCVTIFFCEQFVNINMSICGRFIYVTGFILLKKFYTKSNFRFSKDISIILSIMMFILHFILQHILQIYIILKIELSDIFLSFVTINIFIIIMFLLFFKVSNLNKIGDEYIKLQQEKKNEVTLKFLYEQLKVIKHDLKHDFQLINMYLKEKQYLKIESYINDKIDLLETIPILIKSENTLVDTIINNKIIEAYAKGIQVRTSIMIEKDIFIDEYDLNGVLSNILDNAIDNCSDDGIIETKIIQEKQFIHIKVSNTINKHLFDKELKTKKDPRYRGFGLKSVKRIVDKYHGTMVISHDNSFDIEISLFF